MRTGFLIADHKEYGEGQVISDTLLLSKYSCQEDIDRRNNSIIEKAKKCVEEEGFYNVRLVTVFYKPVVIRNTYVDWREVRQTEKKYEFK